MQSEPRRKLSSNFFHLSTIPEGEEVFASERDSEPQVQVEDVGTIASERVSKPNLIKVKVQKLLPLRGSRNHKI